MVIQSKRRRALIEDLVKFLETPQRKRPEFHNSLQNSNKHTSIEPDIYL